MPRADFRFAHRLRVRYSEVDAQAIVYNPRYLDYADLGVTEYFRALEIPTAPGPQTPEFHAARAVIEYKVPIKLDEEIDVCVRATRIGRSSMTLQVELHGAGAQRASEDLRATVELVYVHVDVTSHRSEPMPAWIIERIEAHAGRKLAAEQL
ncbi:MAG TPA: thioesterase family protein [Magnetospirillaceae bacterium]|jgi:acyl-CoA thioester hydrolase